LDASLLFECFFDFWKRLVPCFTKFKFFIFY
jgi:hypothetical protein